ncbi:restriction endonuclease subunit S [Acinetobacter sp. WCHAc010034]|uniref:restriction endonuclease subunit S n=1 Tax=Acinetobacter sp. WCHAc010034 TaxID=1879049 RepID=UPI000839DA43|nr:restriction endonuclease subunit S [Acinetobacter sp. WCHAc010034]AYA01743.1 restriction endonuclease subunit S [Acinetobacter sp. WCHAc010034]
MQFKQYPSYKPSGVEWLGDVPKHWSVIPSKFYFIERKEKAENKDKQLTASQKYGIVFQEDFMAENGRVMVVMKNPEILKKVRPNDFVISMRSFQGGLELSYLEGSISSAYVMLKPNLHVVDIEYFKYLFKTPRYIQSLQSTSNLIRDGQALRFNNFSQVKLVLPPKSDQHKIVSFLDTETTRIDNLITKQEKLIELLEEQRKSIISHAVTKGLNPNAPMKDSGVEWLGDVPKHWDVIPSKFYFTERKEKAVNADKQLTASQKHGIIYQDEFIAENGRVMVVMKNPEILKKVRPNDFVISMRSFQGGLELSSLEGSISSAYVMLKPDLSLINTEYFKYLFKTPRYIQSLQSTSNLIRDGQALRFNNFSQVKLVLPPKSEQQEIVEYLDKEKNKIDNLTYKQKSLIEKLKEYRSSIISHAVTGKIDVREFTA